MRTDNKNRKKPKYLDISTDLHNFTTNIIFIMTNQLKNIAYRISHIAYRISHIAYRLTYALILISRYQHRKIYFSFLQSKEAGHCPILLRRVGANPPDT